MTLRRDFDWQGWLLPGSGLAVAALLAVLAFVPRGSTPPSPSAITSTLADEHEVITDEGVVSFRFDGQNIVVTLAEPASTVVELARVPVSSVAAASPGESPSPSGTLLVAIVCGGTEGTNARRYVVGHLDATDAQYSGPSAVGRIASDGLLLFAIQPGVPSGAVSIKSEGGSAGLGPDEFSQVLEDGTAQPSGCFVGR